MATWRQLEAHARARGRVDAYGPGWLGLLWPRLDRPPARIRLEHVPGHIGAIAGGCPARRESAEAILRWSSRLPPGCTVILSDGCLWLRYFLPLASATPADLERMLAFVAREGARLTNEPAIDAAECARLFACFAA
jgi:hypothetical protein